MSHPYEIVLVSYRSAHQLVGLLDGLPPGQPFVVVDNAHDVDGVRALAESRPGGRWVDGLGEGFAHAANLGARTSAHEYLVFGNPDSRPTAEVYEALVDEVAADPRCASASATLVDGEGRVEIGVAGWEPSARRAVVHSLGLHKLWPTAGLFARPDVGSEVSVDWTTGAALAVRRETFLSLGGFDEAYYVYNEDVAFGRTVRERGLTQVLRTDLVVPHASGGSGAPSLEMMRLRGASMARYVRRHHGRRSAAATRAALAAGYGLRVVHQVLRRDPGRAREHLAYVAGVTTARAWVGGREVTARG